jgi:hypothetical protein
MPEDTNRSKPYEIRAELLHLAKEILSENMHTRIDLAKAYDKKFSLSAIPGYSTTDVIAEAEKLYAFVTKK